VELIQTDLATVTLLIHGWFSLLETREMKKSFFWAA
jgi:hypothetical protein